MLAALLTRISRRPKRPVARATTSLAACSLDTSATKGTTRSWPWKTSWTAGLMSWAMTEAPRATRRLTVARPIPLAAPVTMATLSWKSPGAFLD